MRSIDQETCDACGPAVRAAVLVKNIPIFNELRQFKMGELTFCGHHGDKFAPAFTLARYDVTDYRMIPGGVAA